jgi:hypothetical protein
MGIFLCIYTCSKFKGYCLSCHCIDKLICLMLKDEDTFEEGISERITMNLTEFFFTKQFI